MDKKRLKRIAREGLILSVLVIMLIVDIIKDTGYSVWMTLPYSLYYFFRFIIWNKNKEIKTSELFGAALIMTLLGSAYLHAFYVTKDESFVKQFISASLGFIIFICFIVLWLVVFFRWVKIFLNIK